MVGVAGKPHSHEINGLKGQTGGYSPTEFQGVSDHLSNLENGLPVVVAEWQRNKREMLRVCLHKYFKAICIDVRTWYRDGEGALKPGKSGLSLSVKHLPDLADALQKAKETAAELGLLNEGQQ